MCILTIDFLRFVHLAQFWEKNFLKIYAIFLLTKCARHDIMEVPRRGERRRAVILHIKNKMKKTQGRMRPWAVLSSAPSI